MSTVQKSFSPALRWTLLICGFAAVGLAVLGIFLPVLPTVPLLLLALACFARSSENFYTWLIDHAHLGPIVRPYVEGRGIPRTSKIKAIVLVWVSITASAFLLLELFWLRILLLMIAAGITLYLLRLPTDCSDTQN